MTPREALLAMWIGSSLADCAPSHRDAVTVTGLAIRIAHDVGVMYTDAEIRAALAADMIWITEGGRLGKIYATTWSARARACATVLRTSAKIGGR